MTSTPARSDLYTYKKRGPNRPPNQANRPRSPNENIMQGPLFSNSSPATSASSRSPTATPPFPSAGLLALLLHRLIGLLGIHLCIRLAFELRRFWHNCELGVFGDGLGPLGATTFAPPPPRGRRLGFVIVLGAFGVLGGWPFPFAFWPLLRFGALGAWLLAPTPCLMRILVAFGLDTLP